MYRPAQHIYAFGPFSLDSRERVLRRDGQPVALTPKAVEILLILVQRAERLVDKDELIRQVWPDAFVEEGNRTKNIFVLRRALGSRNGGGEFIETVPRRGYRFAAEVQTLPSEKPGGEALPANRSGSQARVENQEAFSRVERIDRGRGYAAATQPEPIWEDPNVAAAPVPPPAEDAVTGQPAMASRSDELLEASRLSRGLIAAGMLGILLIAGAVFWLTGRQSSPSVSAPELKQWQLTDNSSDNAVTSGAVSPDGRYLAYADVKGIHIKLIETGETADVRQPEEFDKLQVNWMIVPTWLRDGTRFIANANLPGHRSSIWAVPVIGGLPRKIRDEAEAHSVSRDGSSVAFLSNWGRFGYRELWVMKPDGDGAHKLYDTDDSRGFYGAEWSPDGQRLAYMIMHEGSDKGEVTIESRDLKGGLPVAALADAAPVEDWSWLPDGRIIYAADESVTPAENCNLWSLQTDRNGKPTQKPKRLTDWAGLCMDSPSTSADSKRLIFRRWRWQANVYIADLDPTATHLSVPRRFTRTEGRNFPAAWTVDGKAVVFESYRDREWQLLKQSLDRDTPELLATMTDQMWNAQARLSPDGAWVLYPGAYSSVGGSSVPYQVLRVRITGGRPEQVLSATFYDSIQSRTAPSCARAPANLCAIAERSSDGKQITFTAFDPLKGRGREITHLDVEPSRRDYIWDISPDGFRIALLQLLGEQPGHSPAGKRIQIIPLDGQPPQELTVKGCDNLQSVEWAADGKGLFVSCARPAGSALLHVDLRGNARMLWERKEGIEPWFASAPWAVPSPDGRHLAIYDWSLSANMWMVQNF